jgi:hypothetical protein
MRAEDRHLASRQFFLISTLRQRSRHFRLGQQRAPLQSRLSNRPPEIPEIPIIILRRPITSSLRCTPWMRQEIAGGKGAKGGTPLQQSAVRDSSTISETSLPLAARCWHRFGAQRLGANRRILPAQTFHRETIRGFAVSPTGCSPAVHLKTGSGNCGKCGNCR